MPVSRWFGLCSRLVHTRIGRGTWRTRAGHLKKYANIREGPQWRTVVSTRLSHSGVGDMDEHQCVQRYLQQLVEEHRELSDKLQQVYLNESDRKELMKRHTELLPLAHIHGRIEQALKEHEEVCSLLQGSASTKDEDEQMTQLLKEEEAQMSGKVLALREDLIKALVPTDPLDSSNVLLEVVSGRTTGGDICQQFTKEMFDMYQGFAYYKNWDFEVYNYTPAEYGIAAECQQTRSQLQNRDAAMRVLRARLCQSMIGKETKQRHTARKQQVGTRSQSERIRSYNFSQDRVTDHRTGYVTREIKEFMRGEEALDDLISHVLDHTEREALLEMVESSSSGLTQPQSGRSAD